MKDVNWATVQRLGISSLYDLNKHIHSPILRHSNHKDISKFITSNYCATTKPFNIQSVLTIGAFLTPTLALPMNP